MKRDHLRPRALALSAVGLSVMAAATLAEARVTRFVVEERVVVAGGMSWGSAGPYERLKGRAYMEVNPRDPLNAVIVNLDRAPRNARGNVEFDSPVMILKPLDMARGNRKIWVGLNNRGNCIEYGFRAFPTAPTTCNPLTVDDIGANNVLLRQGYAVVDLGWHGDGMPNPTQLFPNFPVAKHSDGGSIVGPLRIEYTPAADTYTMRIVTTPWKPYVPADTNTARSSLSVQDREGAPRITIAPNRWAYGTCPAGQASLVPDSTNLCLFDGFRARKLYQLIYPARDPIVMGLAYAVTRDIASFLRYDARDSAGNANPLRLSTASTGIRRAYSSGTSSTGMYQRDFLYLGFNEDESHRKVFDGATILTAGAHRLFANVQFAHPTFYSRQDINHDYTSNSIVPFTFAVTRDPITGIRDGILKRPATDPYVMQIDGGIEFWHWQASLNVVDGQGNPVDVPRNVRLYHLGGTQHVLEGVTALAPAGPPGICQAATQTNYGRALARALTVAMDEWADHGIRPPENAYPGLDDDDDLITLDRYKATFPSIPGFTRTDVQSELTVMDFGPAFTREGGIQTVLPPRLGRSYKVFQARIDRDGNDLGGVDHMALMVPLGTNLGWNVRAGFRAPDLCGLTGGFAAFANTRAERLASGDPRRSLAERYGSHDGYVKEVAKAADKLVKKRLMLREDADAHIRAAQDSSVLR
jgi:hypothetical protein